MSFYYKTSWSTVSNKPLIKVYLHRGAWYDHANGAVNASASSSNDDLTNTNLIAYCKKSFNPSTGWTRFADKFINYTNNSDNTDNDYSTIKRPQYILASFSTNETAGGGTTSDKLSLDELFCIYDKGLATLTIGENPNASATALSYFNGQEFLTHEPLRNYNSAGDPDALYNSGSATWDYTNPFCYASDSDFPQVVATPKSKLITNFVIDQATIANPHATITVTHNDNSTFTYTINFTNARPKPSVTLNNNGTYTPCMGTNATMTVSGTAQSYAWSDNLGSQTTVNIPTATAGEAQYTVTGTGSNGCTATATAFVDVKPLPTVTINGSANATVNGCASATLTASGAATPQDYSWSNGTTSTNAITAPQTGNYTVTGTSNYGCTATATATVTIYGNPTVTISGPPSACSDTVVALTASGASSYVWKKDGTTLSSTADTLHPSATGDYTVTGTDANGCSNTSTAHHFVRKETPQITISGTAAICSGNSTVLRAGSSLQGTTYHWSNNTDADTLLVSAGGTYSVTGTLNGCSSSDAVQVNESPTPSAPTVTNTSVSRCGQGQVTLEASTDAGSIVWYANTSTMQATHTGSPWNFDANGNITYYAAVLSTAGCVSNRVPVSVTVNPVPDQPTAQDTSLCGTQTIALTATPAAGCTLSWFSDAQGTQPITNTTVTVSNTTTYYVASNTAANCPSALKLVTVTVNPVPGAPTLSQTTYCKSEGNSLQLSATAGTNGDVLRWRIPTDNNPIQSNNGNYMINANVANPLGTYNVSTYNTTTHCESQQVSVLVAATPTVGVTATPTAICEGDTVTLNATGADSYSWGGNVTGATVKMTPATTTSYTVTGETSDGCTNTATVQVTVNPLPGVPTVNATSVYACGGEVTLSATPATGTTLKWYDAEGALQGTGNNLALTNVTSATTYSVVDSNSSTGCTSTPVSIAVTPATIPTVPTVTPASICGGGQVTLGASSSTSNVKYIWYNNNNVSLDTTTSGSYTTTVNGTTPFKVAAYNATTGCVSDKANVTATVNPIPTVTATATPAAICVGDTATLTASGADSYSWGGNVTGATVKMTPAENTTYTVTGETSAGCTSTATVTVAVNDLPGVPTPGLATYCYGGSNLTINATAGANGDMLRWRTTPTGSPTPSNNGNYIINANNGVGTYYVSTYNSTTGCESQQVSVLVAATPTVGVTATPTAICAGDTVTLSATGADSYNWGGNVTGATVKMTPAESTSYTVTGETSAGCTNTATVQVTVNPLPGAPTVDATSVYACGGEVTLIATPVSGTTVKWYDAEGALQGTNNSLALTSVTSATTYSVAGYNSTTGCTSAPVSIAVTPATEPADPTVTPASRCGGGQVTLGASSTTSGVKYIWYNNNNVSLDTTTSGSYTTTVNGNTTFKVAAYDATTGCVSDKVNVTATVTSAPAAPAANNQSVCGAQEITLTATAADNCTLAWFSDELGTQPLDSATVTVSNTTTYYVANMTADNCRSALTPVTVTVNPIPGAPTPGQTTYCKPEGSNVQMSATMGANGTTLYWRLGATGNPTTSDGNYSANTVDTTYYVSTYNSTTHCESQRVPVLVAAKPTVAATATPTAICAGDTVTLVATGADSYSWDGNVTGATVKMTPDTTTTYTVIGTATSGCTNTATVQVTVNPLPGVPTVDATSVYACGGEVTLSATPVSGTTLKWYNAQGTEQQGTGNNLALTNVTSATTYSVAGYNSTTGCTSAPVSIAVTPATIPAVPTVTPDSICGGGQVTLGASSTTSGAEYIWYNNNNVSLDTTSGSYTTTVNGNTTFKVAAYDATTGCVSDKANVTATVKTIPTVTATAAPAAICAGDTATLTASGADTYSWSNNETVSTIRVVPSDTTTYTVTGTAANGCTNTATVTVNVKEIPGLPTTTAPAPQCLVGNNVQLNLTATAGNGGSYAQWYDANMTARAQNTYGIRITATTTYYVSTVGTNGCESEAIPVVVVINPLPATPNVSGVSRCGEGSVTFVAAPATNIQYKWYDDNDILIATTDSNYTTTVTTSKNFKVAAYNTETGCESAKTTVAATVNEVPAAPTVTSPAHCGAYTVNLTATAATGCTLTWYSDPDSTQVLSNTTQEVAQTTSFYVMATAQNGCRSALQEMVVTINEIPAAPTVADPQIICQQGSDTLTATPAADCVIRWYDSNNTYLAEGNTYVTPTIQTTTQYGAVNYNANTNCSSAATMVEVPVKALPATPVLTGTTLCGAGNATLTAAAVAGVTTTWYQDADLSTTVGTGSTLQIQVAETTTFYAINTNDTTNCVSASANVIATVYPTYNVNDTAVACVQYVWNNETFTASGDYTRTLHTVNNCDSVVTLHLTINPVLTQEITIDECDSWTWNNQNYTTSGDYTQTLSSVVTGCDSVVTAHVTIRHSTASQQQLTLCSNELPYTYAGTQITSAGVKTITIENQQGCDSVITLTVVVNPQPGVPTLTNTQRCGAGAVTLNASVGTDGTVCRWYADSTVATPFREGGNYNVTLQATTTYYVSSYNANTHCESPRMPVTATIDEVPAQPAIENVARCGAGSVTMSVNPANSELTYRWFVNGTTTSSFHTGDSYTTNIQNTTNYYVDAYNAATGCFSTRKAVTATMNTIPAAPVTINAENCGANAFQLETYVTSTPSTTFRWYEDNTTTTPMASANTGTVAASRSYFVSNYNETTTCESPRSEIQITIYPVYDPVTLTDAICQGTTYTQYGQNTTYNQPGTYNVLLNQVSSHGCDSLVTLVITVNPTSEVAYQAQVCAGTRYQGYGFDTTAMVAGTYTLTHHSLNALGCDSTTTLTLTVNPVKNTVINTTICATASYNFNGQTLNQPGTYTANLQTVNGCDSTVTLNLSVAAEYRDTIVAHICDGASYTANGFNANATGFYTQNLQATNGCDSVVVLNLTVHQLSTTNLTAEICLGESYTANGFQVTPTAAGTETHQRVVQTQYGCDSTVNLTLTVNPVYQYNEADTICSDEIPYAWHNQSLNASGVYYDNHNSVHGCDSNYTFTLTVLPAYHHNTTVTLCDNSSQLPYMFAGEALTTSGHYTHNFHTAAGCDSIVELELVINPTYSINQTVEVCDNELPYVWNNRPEFTYSAAGEYTINLQTANGCDSIYHLTLIVHPTYSKDTTITVCQGALPYAFDATHSFNQAGNYDVTLQSQYGCDSIWHVQFHVQPYARRTENVTICADALPYVYDANHSYNAAGVYDIMEEQADGCNTIVTLTLTVNPTYLHFDTVTVCANTLPYVYDNITMAAAGTYTLPYLTVNGCDSIVKVTLKVTDNPTNAVTEYVCADAFPFTYAGESYAAAGTYDVVFQTNGCDSLVTLTIVEVPVYHFTERVETCENALPYLWHGQSLTVAGTYTDNHTSIYGCDSNYTLTFTISDVKRSYEDASICEGDSYQWHNKTLSVSGVYSDTLSTSSACDSICQLTLTVNPVYHNSMALTVCQSSEPYHFAAADTMLDVSAVATTTIVFHKTTVNGCDSVTTLTLTVTPSYSFSETADVCSYDMPYTWRGKSLTAAGTYYDSLQTAAGCDSVYALTLNVISSMVNTSEPVEICQGETYTWRNRTITESGLYRDTVTNAQGCYDIYEVDVTVHPTYLIVEKAAICDNELPYQWRNRNLTAAGTYEVNYQTATYCDSIYRIILMVYPSYNFSETTTICSDETPYSWHGQSLTATGVYYDSLHTADGCDSIYMLALTVNPSYSFAETMTICSDEAPYNWRGQSLTATGVYYDSLQTAAGCDSVYALTLTVNQAYHFNETESVCSFNLPYVWRNHEYTESGVYYDSLQTAAGCDSIYTLNLSVTSIIEINMPTIELCEGMTQMWRGKTISAAGEYRDTVMNASGCYDIYVVNALVHPTYHYYDTMTVCQSALPYQWGGHNFTAAETYVLNLQTSNGCDSIREYTLIVNPTYNYNETVTLCADAVPYNWHGLSLTTTGVYYDSLQTVAGCDSVYTLNLTVNPVYSFTETMTICASSAPYSWHGKSLTATGVYYDSLQTAAGCDSVYVLTLTVNPVYSFSETASVCSYDLPYSWRGRSLTATGVYYDSLQTVAGCDSIYALTLTVNQSQTITNTTIELCEGMTQTWRGKTISAAGEYRDTVMNATGCYDVYVVNAIVHPTYHYYDTMTVCQSALPYQWGGHNFTAAETYVLNLQTSNGCDSIREYTLIVNPTYNYNETMTLCADAVPYNWHGLSLTTTGVYYDNLQTVAGCDSIYTLTLTVNPVDHQYDTATVCSSSLPYSWRGLQLNASGHYTDTIPNSYGCSDIYELLLTVNPTPHTVLYDTICQGEHYAQFGFDTIPASYGTVQMQSLHTSAAGCDSTVTLLLTVNRTYEFVTYASTCDNQPYEWRGHTYDTAGVYYDTYQTQSGCDSVYVLDLILTPTYEIFVEDSALRNHEYVGYGLTITPADSGTFTYDIQNFTIDGCDSIIHLTLHVAFNYGIEQHVAEQREFTVYPNPATTVVNIKGEDMRRIQVYNGLGKLVQMVEAEDDKYVQIQLSGYAPGNYFLRILLSDGQVVSKKIIVRP